MSAGWVAGSVRAASLSRRRLGAAGARSLAASPDLTSALVTLAASPYGHDVRVEHTLAQAQHAAGATLLWHLRVLAGWLPRDGADAVRLLAAGFEIANVEEHLCLLDGRGADPAYRLGSLETAWSRMSASRSYGELRQVLGNSAWGDPCGNEPHTIATGLRLAWADRLLGSVPEAATWARGGTLLLLLRETMLAGRVLPAQLIDRAATVLGSSVVGEISTATTPRTLVPLLPVDIRWTLDGVNTPSDLWLSQGTWCRRVESDSFALLRSFSFGRATIVGAVGLLAIDAWRVRAALETAARTSRGPSALEAFDAVA
jgi:hypothetical protein